MARLVELDQMSGGPVWINPEHVVAVHPHPSDGAQVVTEMGQRFHVAGEPQEVVDALHLIYRVDLTDRDRALVVENLKR